MKKVLSIALALVMCLGLCACGGNGTPKTTEVPTTAPTTEANTETTETQFSKEEMLKNAQEIDGSKAFGEYNDNKAKFVSQYEGETFLVSGSIYEIEMDHIIVEDGNLLVRVYIPNEEIIELQKGQYVEVVGVAENINLKEQLSRRWVTFDFNSAYLIKSNYTVSGKYFCFKTTDGTHPEGLCLQYLTNSGRLNYIELDLAKEQRETLTNGVYITVEGKMLENDNSKPYSASLKLIDITLLDVTEK